MDGDGERTFTNFTFNSTHRVVVCRQCETCVVPGRTSVERHLRRHPHSLLSDVLKSTTEYLLGLDLKPLAELHAHKPARQCAAIKHLKLFEGYACLLCVGGDGGGAAHDGGVLPPPPPAAPAAKMCAPFCTIHHLSMMRHVSSVHGTKPKTHKSGRPLWKECQLQTYFCAKGRINYFVVATEEDDNDIEAKGGTGAGGRDGDRIVEGEGGPLRDLLATLKEDVAAAKSEAVEGVSRVVEAFETKASRVPWLERTGFSSHLLGVLNAEIRSSYQLPKVCVGRRDQAAAEDMKGEDGWLVRICNAAELMLQDAYLLCSDTSPNRKMTQQRANILNEFYAGSSGRSDGFRYYKNPSTLVKYFTTFKQLLMYYFRVVYSEDGHFTTTHPDQPLPGTAITPTRDQKQAMQCIMAALEGDDDILLKYAIRKLYLALICHIVGSVPYRSAVLSFASMLSRRGNGLWEEPGNFNSHLSALTWTAQLVIFAEACFVERDDEDRIPIFLQTICHSYFQQLAESPFGHILQWRLYLFKVGKASVTKHQARWSLDGETVEYKGTELRMSDVQRLVVSEYQRAHVLLYNELLFGMNNMLPMQSWRLRDDLDVDDVGFSWMMLHENMELLDGCEVKLLEQIHSSAELKDMFIVQGVRGEGDGPRMSEKAMDLYEANAQDLLKRLMVLCHLTSGQPLRQPELLSIKWRNTARLRNILIWQGHIMLYTQYHKGQQQSGMYKNNMRFLPKQIGNLLLDYMAYVLPLRQLFLRQKSPRALLSPHLFSKLDGTVWPDGTLSQCLSKACMRSEVPRLHTSNWRQITVSICKEKFSRKERAYFDVDNGAEGGVSDDEEEQELMAMAEQSNHSYHTFNHAYAGSSTISMNTLLHRNYRASESWRMLFRFEQILLGKRMGDFELSQMQQEVKRSRVRKRKGYSASELTTMARSLLRVHDLKLREPGQRRGLMAVLGAKAVEQVVVVLGTGSGKSLLFMLGVSAIEAETTILILPMVSLRRDMLRRCLEVGIRPVVWQAGLSEKAKLVIVSAEAACTQSFLEYAHYLNRRQQLDRVVIDECHLTVTASDYRPRMLELGWYIRQLRTQTVWLTATLPPSMEVEFVEHNKLVRPTIIRESTNRPNIKYNISYEVGPDTLVERAVKLIRSVWPRRKIFDHSRDKIIIYCRTRDKVETLASLLGCPSYTSRSGSEDEKASIISRWLGDRDQPVIAATSALGVGFDYPHVRWVVHVDAPGKLTDFSQESGRAGRDGRRAASIVLLGAGWVPSLGKIVTPDEEAMQLYLTRKFCARAILSQFLDSPEDWRWCMVGDEPCQVCRVHHDEARPVGVAYSMETPMAMEFTGPGEVLRQDHVKGETLDRYEQYLETFMRTCLYCRVMQRDFSHAPNQCSRRHEWIRVKDATYQLRRKEGKDWIPRYIVCWRCYQSQDICRVADPDHEESVCRFPDMVMPLCYGIYHRVGGKEWLQKHFGRSLEGGLEEYMLWLGEKASLKGNKCIQANCVAAVMMQQF